MAQHDMNIANQSFPDFEHDVGDFGWDIIMPLITLNRILMIFMIRDKIFVIWDGIVLRFWIGCSGIEQDVRDFEQDSDDCELRFLWF